MDLLHSFNLTQHISGPTHKNNHTLDLIITRSDEQFAWNFSVHDPGISDHFAVHCYLSIKKPPALKKEFTYRKLRSVDLTQFNLDVANSPLLSSSESSLAPLCDQYDTIISAIVDSHAPVHKKLISPRPAAPWYTGDIDVEKTKRRNLERRWRRSGLHIDRQMYLEQCQLVKSLIYSTKMNYFSSLIVENKPNPNALLKTIDRLLHRKPVQRFPSCDSAVDLANMFAKYFSDNITLIRNQLDTYRNQTSTFTALDNVNLNCKLAEFYPTTEDELSELIGKCVSLQIL
jgi:hypothetical protein